MTDPSASLPIVFPIEPQPEMCGHCGQDTEMNGHWLQCYSCGKLSNLDGTPIFGNGHFRANISTTFPEANAHGMPIPGTNQIA